MSTITVEFRIPTEDNRGVPMPETHRRVIDAILHSAGGLTQHAAEGVWTGDTGELFVDSVKVYTSEVDIRKLPEIVQNVGDVMEDTDQITVFVKIGSVSWIETPDKLLDWGRE